MALWFLPELLVIMVTFVLVTMYLYFWPSTRSKNNPLIPTNWPIAGMIPSVIANLGNLHNYITEVVTACGNNFMLQGPPGMRLFVTCDPTNVRHIFTSNHANYPKGEAFAAIFDIMRGALFTSDGEAFRRERAKFQTVLSDPRLLVRMAACCCDKVDGLLSLLIQMASHGAPFDMHDLIARFVFDLTATPVLGVDPALLSPDLPPVDPATAMDTVMEAAFFRHIVPPSCWKVMRWLKIGPERKLAPAHATLHRFLTEMMERRRISLADSEDEDQHQVDALSSYINHPDYPDDLLRATLLHYMIAGRDTTGSTLPWVFYNLAKNPHVVSTIRDELSPIARKVAAVGASNNSCVVTFDPEETKSLVFLRAVLYESLRLYPAVPIERKTVVDDDVMPSGHEVRAGDTILASVYAMGRAEAVWGEDCHEYKPERWISEEDDGSKKVRYVPSHKFLAFNSGPRMCIGKEIAVMLMSTVVAAVAWNFDVEVLEGHSIQPKLSCILQMKNGLVVKVKKRQVY